VAHPFFTIGHSTRTIGEFLELLSDAQIRLLVDVRSLPGSRTNPQFNEETFSVALAGSQIGYRHMAALGGLRKRSRDVPEGLNAFWQNRGFHNYADYAMGEDFHVALDQLRAFGHATPCAIMCAEAVWWRCHRRIIADYLIAAGETVFHILNRRRIEPAHLTSAARVGSTGTLTYPLG
jgi:uncharacterized protein (DUF488 family)